MFLSNFDLEFVSQKSIKRKVITNQLANAPLLDASPLDINLLEEDIFQVDVNEKFTLEEFNMMMYFDGSKYEQGGGVGVIFFIPQGVPIPYSFKFAFMCTNNNAKYEALILDLRIAINLKVDKLMIYDDSLLIVNQVLGIYQYHNNFLKSYKDLAINPLKHFKFFKIELALRSLNHFIDTMASLDSTQSPSTYPIC